MQSYEESLVPMYEAKFVDSLDCKGELSHVETGYVFGEDFVLDEHSHQVTTREEFHEQIEEGAVLKRCVELDNPRAVRFGQDVTLSANVSKLILLVLFLKSATSYLRTLESATDHLRLDQSLEGIGLAIILALDELDFSESTLADNLDGREIFCLLLGPQEAKVLPLGAPHSVRLSLFAAVGDFRVCQILVKLHRSTVC